MTPNRTALLAEAESLLRSVPFTKEISSKIDSLLQLADRTVDRSELLRATMARRDRELGRAPLEVHELTPADEQFAEYLRASEPSEVRRLEKRAGLGVTTDSAGGFTAPAGFAQHVESTMAAYDQLFDACTTFETQRGGAFVYPILDDAESFASVVGEGTTSDTSADVVFAGIQFPKIQTFRSGFVPVSWELLQDSSFDVPTLLETTFGKRLARGVGRYLVGVLHASAPIGKTAASGTVVTSNEVIDLMDSLDADYQSNASFLMSQGTLNSLHKVVTTGGAYVFPPQQDASGRQLLMGRRVFVSHQWECLPLSVSRLHMAIFPNLCAAKWWAA
jgi:HK97 family phage major capsid protein